MDLSQNNLNNQLRKKLNAFFSKKVIFSILIIVIIATLLFSNKFVKTKGFKGIVDFVSIVGSNYWKGMDANPESISIEIKEKDLKILEKNRQQALDRGLIINDLDGEYVPATIEYKGKKIKISMRLKGHMTDHIDTDNKWSFRIKVKEKGDFMGMKRFSIQQPGTRGYIYEWIYHELMKQEDIIALRYKFINVSINGKDWGIYALEENFENELIANNYRLKGPILRFNPDMYWVNRYSSVRKENSVDEFASYYSANPEAYREEKVLKDSLQKQYYLKALSLIEGLRTGQLKVSDAFDIPRLAKFHAVIELVGGLHSIDWSDIKYYFNPATQRLEPVAYESFTELSSRYLSSQYKYVSLDSLSNYTDWHEMLFSDPKFFTEYMKNVERLCKKEYLDKFFEICNKELEANLAILYKEYPYKKFERTDYYQRQKSILRVLNAPDAIHAYFVCKTGDQLQLQVGAIDALPVQIKSITIGNIEIKPRKQIILPAKQASEFVTYSNCNFMLPPNFVWHDSLASSITLKYNFLGASLEKTDKVFPYPQMDNTFIAEHLQNEKGNLDKFNFLFIDEQQHAITVKEGNYQLKESLVIPDGYSFIVAPGVKFDLVNGASIQSSSAMFFEGMEDAPIVVTSTDSSSQGISVVGAQSCVFNHVGFKNIARIKDPFWKRTAALTFYETPVKISNCTFTNLKADDALQFIRSVFTVDACFFQNIKNDAIDIDFSEGEISNAAFEVCHQNALDISMSKVKIKAIVIDGAKNKGLNVKAGGQLNGSDIRIKHAAIGISVEDNSMINLNNITIDNSKIGVVGYKNKAGGGHPSITLNKIMFKEIDTNYMKEEKSSLIINGVQVKDEMKNVEEELKSDKKNNR